MQLAASKPGLLAVGFKAASLLGRALLYVLQALAVLGCVAISVMALAALGNAAFGPTNVPDDLKNFITAVHLLLIFLTLPLSALQLVLPKGRGRHKAMGYTWCALILASTLLSFGIYGATGGFNTAHFLSVLALVFLPLIVLLARRKQHTLHRVVVVCFILFFQVGAGAATFLPHRAMGQMFWPLWQ